MNRIGTIVALLLLGSTDPAACKAMPSYVVKVAPERLQQVEAEHIGRGYTILQRNEEHSFLVVRQPSTSNKGTVGTASAAQGAEQVPLNAAAGKQLPGWMKYNPTLMATGDAGSTNSSSPVDTVSAAAAGSAIAPGAITSSTKQQLLYQQLVEQSSYQVPQQQQQTQTGTVAAAAVLTTAAVQQQLHQIQGVEEVQPNSYMTLLGRSLRPTSRALKAAIPPPAAAASADDSTTQGACSLPPDYVNPDLDCGKTTEGTPYGVKMVEADTEAIIQINRENRNNVMWCVIDTGLDSTNPEFDPSTTTGCQPGFVRPDGSKHLCEYPWNKDLDSHGTHTSGTIAAKRNGFGIVGVAAEGAQIYHYNIFGSSEGFYYTDLILAWQDCIAELDYRKASANIPEMKMVVSMSVGGPGDVKVVADWLGWAAQQRAKDVLFVAAAGNNGSEIVNFPAGDPNVVSVAAVSWRGLRASFSSFNDDVEWAAPGVLTLSTVPLWAAPYSSYNTDVIFNISPFATPTDNPDILLKPPMLMLSGSKRGVVSGQMVDCGLGGSPCTNAAGKICLMQRGGKIMYCQKVLNCLAGGGIAAVIYGQEDEAACNQVSGTLYSEDRTVCPEPSSGWPIVVSAARIQGYAIRQSLVLNPTVDISTGQGNAAMEYLSGTSMATPAAAGVAGVVWSAHATCTAAEIRNAISATAADVGTVGRDKLYGFGIVKALAAHNYLLANPCNGLPPDSSPVPAVVLDCIGRWSDWSKCSVDCGIGVQTSTYSIQQDPINGGKACEAERGATRSRNCSGLLCPVDCVGDWEWSLCDKQCGGGMQEAIFRVILPAERGGKPCEAEQGAKQRRACNEDVCAKAVDDNIVAVSGQWTNIYILANDIGSIGEVQSFEDPVKGGEVILSSSQLRSQPASYSGSTGADGGILYLSKPGFVGTDTFTYTIIDNIQGGESTATVTVTVTPGSCDASNCGSLGKCDPSTGQCICPQGSGMKATFVPNPNKLARTVTPDVPACRYSDFVPMRPFNLRAVTAAKGSKVAVKFRLGNSRACLQNVVDKVVAFQPRDASTCPDPETALQLPPTSSTLAADATECSDGRYTHIVRVPGKAGCYRLVLRLADSNLVITSIQVF